MRRVRRTRMKRAARAGDLLDQIFKNSGMDERMQQYRALVIWDDIVGPQIAARTKPSRIRDGVLEVCVDQPSWMQQLHLMKPQLLRKLNAELGDCAIKDIFLKRGKVTARASRPLAVSLPWHTMTLETEERQHVEELLKGVEDQELRQELKDFLLKQTRLEKTLGGEQA